MHERLLVVAHGTGSPVGLATLRDIVRAVSATRPDITVELCYLDVAEPKLADALDDRPTIAVPLLLSTGYHAQADIPAAAAPHPAVSVARHLGPHPLLVDVLTQRLAEALDPQPGDPQPVAPSDAEPPSVSGTVVLAAAGSSRPEAAVEVARTAAMLGERLGRPVETVTMAHDLSAFFAALATPIAVATYLLAEGQFVSTLAESVGARGAVAAPLGAHPKLAELVWLRYDEARATARLPRVAG